jgi:hypothetical protein
MSNKTTFPLFNDKVQTAMPSNYGTGKLPKIIKTIFHIDDTNGRIYNIDMNEDTDINHIKSIVQMTARVNKLGLRMFHKATDIEYTKYTDETLEELFPGLETIEFFAIIDRSYRLEEEHNQLKMGKTCEIHPHKYCIFYCFDCQRSLCSKCVGSGEHQDCSFSEKFDYLKPSVKLVDNMFSDIDNLVEQVSSNNDNKSDIEQFKIKLKMNYFPTLQDQLKKIEAKVMEQIDYYNSHCTVTVNSVKNNSVKLKKSCIEGLDELKYQIDIENMLKDEGVFLHFDAKVKQMTDEKGKIYEDTQKLQNVVNTFNHIKHKLEAAFNEIKVFLDQYLELSVYDDIKRSCKENHVTELNESGVMNKLLSHFKKTKGKIISEAKVFGTGKKNAHMMNNSSFLAKALGTTVFNNMDNHKHQVSNGIFDSNENKPDQDFSYSNGVQGGHSHNTTKYQTMLDQTNNINNTINYSGSKNNQLTNSGYKDKEYSFISEKMSLEINEKNIDKEKLIWIIKACQKDTKIIVFVDGDPNIETKVMDRFITFNPQTHGISAFLPNITFINTGKGLYISGGEITPGQGSDMFFYYNPLNNQVQRREDMLEKKFGHSLVCYNDFVYSVGGYKTNSCERFDTKHGNGKWTRLSNMISEERQKPILCVHNNFLYAFFGYSNGQYLNTVERVNLKNAKCKWEQVPYNIPENIENLGRVGSAIIPHSDGSIYIIGGKNSEVLSSLVKFDFSNNTFTLYEFTLEEQAHFNESNFLKLSDNDYGLFNENLNQLLRLNL